MLQANRGVAVDWFDEEIRAGDLVFTASGDVQGVIGHVGMAMGVAPVTGITLPMVSVGGSSLVANLVAIGVLEAIRARGRPLAGRPLF